MSGEVIIARPDIQNLKAAWRRDPCWDIEDTEGFEEHRAELLAFRQDCERQWKEEREAKYLAKAEQAGCAGNMKLGEYLMTLEARIDGLEIDLFHVKYPLG